MIGSLALFIAGGIIGLTCGVWAKESLDETMRRALGEPRDHPSLPRRQRQTLLGRVLERTGHGIQLLEERELVGWSQHEPSEAN
ncbi:MAG: hypothetical protein HY560_00580 [Gemmatimonadetes bacterium]|nr:hypothetical protein [Gemmatimonadota bacterium]